MAAEEFTFRVCTPKGVFLEEKVSEVTLPSALGEMGVLPGHTDYTGNVGTGVLEYVPVGDSSAKRLVVSGGFASFTDGTLLLLSDNADSSETVDKESYAEARSECQSAVDSEVLDSPEWARAKTALDRIEAIDELISH